ncbi:hypothetical protein BV22DRAFT_1030922 [Leucogyrophana mollusca]|uniref:Uncharacterized protein n=1 Tax=Leucogyrophana mollusca TaxID=85980 RepID=A0ACB8BS26_9AGAM|nr:hypothetical protein BV22DRAFT_1030922 [Leucogyrophana mollusca]
METYDDWTNLLPFFSGFMNPSDSQQPEDDTHAPVSASPSPPPITPVYRSVSFESSIIPPQHDAENTFFVSTAFPSGSIISPCPPDLILLSSDSVYFYVHRSVLEGASDNAFNLSHISFPSSSDGSADPVITVPESSMILTVVLLTVYGLSSSRYSPSLEDLSAAVESLDANSLPLTQFISPLTPLLLAYAPGRALEVYTLAARYNLDELAVAASGYLLSLNLSSLTDEMAEQIGPIYLRRLFMLHFERLEALKRILMPPPHPHPATPACQFGDQSKLTRAWTLATAYLAWDSRVGSYIGPSAHRRSHV